MGSCSKTVDPAKRQYTQFARPNGANTMRLSIQLAKRSGYRHMVPRFSSSLQRIKGNMEQAKGVLDPSGDHFAGQTWLRYSRRQPWYRRGRWDVCNPDKASRAPPQDVVTPLALSQSCPWKAMAWSNGEKCLVDLWQDQKKNGSEGATDGFEDVFLTLSSTSLSHLIFESRLEPRASADPCSAVPGEYEVRLVPTDGLRELVLAAVADLLPL